MSSFLDPALETGSASGAIAAITAISSLRQVYKTALHRYELSNEIRMVAIRLPLVEDTLRSIKTVFEANHSAETAELVGLVFELCRMNGKKMEDVVAHLVPPEGVYGALQDKNPALSSEKIAGVTELMQEIVQSLLQLKDSQVLNAAIDVAKLEAVQKDLNQPRERAKDSFDDDDDDDDDAVMTLVRQTSGLGTTDMFGSLHEVDRDFGYCADIFRHIGQPTADGWDSAHRANIQWELPQFVERYLDGDKDLSGVFTITGSATKALAATSRQYIARVWGHLGSKVLDIIPSILDGKPATLVTENIRVELCPEMSGCSARFSTTPGRRFVNSVDFHREAVATVIQVLAWLASIFRLPKIDRPHCSNLLIEPDRLGQCCVKLGGLEPVTSEQCWHELLPNTTIAAGFPSGNGETVGLDIGWEIMLELADVLFQTDLSKMPVDKCDSSSEVLKDHSDSSPAQGIFYSGVGTLLYPIERFRSSSQNRDVFKWHFDKTGASALPPRDTVLPPCTEEDFARSRHLLGFVPKHECRLGTRDRAREHARMSPVAGSIEQSAAEISREGIFATLGKPPMTTTLNAGVTFSKALRAIRDPRERRYDSILRHTERQAVILCDVGPNKAAWLVPQISVILDLVCYRIQREGWSQLPRYALPQANGGAAAAVVLRDAAVYKMTLAKSLEGDEDFRVLELVKEIYCAMAKRLELQEERARGTVRLQRKRLHSWDLLELADPPDKALRREVAVHKTGSPVTTEYPSWLPLSDELLVLSAQDLGKVLTVYKRPIRVKKARRGEMYLMANVYALETLHQKTFDCDHYHLDGGLVLTLPSCIERQYKWRLQHDWKRQIRLRDPGKYSHTLTKESEHGCETRTPPAKLGRDGLVIFGPERKGLLARLIFGPMRTCLVTELRTSWAVGKKERTKR